MATYKVNPSMSHSKIQSYLAIHNSKIIFTAGIYTVKKPFLLYSSTEIQLEKGAVLKRMAKCYVFQSSVGCNVTKYSGCHDISIHGGKIICNGSTQPSNIISLFHSKNIKIYDMTIKDNVGNHAIEINSSCNVTIDNVTFDGNKQVEGCEFREMIQLDYAYKTGLPIYANANYKCYDGTPCENITIKNCTFKGSNIAIGTHTCMNYKNQHKNIVIDNNKFTSDGVLGKYGAFVRCIGMDNVKITNNMVSNVGRLVEITTPNKFYNKNSTTTTIPSKDVTGCSNIVIERNTILKSNTTFKYNGVYVTSKFDTIEHTGIVVKNNKLNGAKNNI